MSPKAAKAVAPDDLVRTAAGAYRSGDGRFEVQKSDTRWFLVDSQQTDELGQQLLHGPFATLSEVTAALPGARAIKVTPVTPAQGLTKISKPA
jgi:hypothetical protein